MNALQLHLILLIAIGKALELPRRVNKIARVDSHLVGYLSSRLCRFRVEMNVGHQGHAASHLPQALANEA